MNTSSCKHGLQVKQAQIERSLPQGKHRRKREFFHCDVVFGLPSADCRGTGMCKIVAREERPMLSLKPDCKTTAALFTGNDNNPGGVSMLLFREFLCVRLWRAHLAEGVLTLTEPCRLPASLCSNLNLKSRWLQPGTYTMEEKLGYFQIDF